MKKIKDAKKDLKGNITSVLFEGNTSYTPLPVAISMVENGKAEGVAVTKADGSKHLRSRPNGSKADNLSMLARD